MRVALGASVRVEVGAVNLSGRAPVGGGRREKGSRKGWLVQLPGVGGGVRVTQVRVRTGWPTVAADVKGCLDE